MDFSHLSTDAIISDPLWLIEQFIIIVIICFSLGKVHEALHVYKAKKLGYRIISTRLFKNEVDVDIEPLDPNVKKIGMFPYIFLVPLGWVLVPLGYLVDSFGILIAGIATIIIHGLSLGKEGK